MRGQEGSNAGTRGFKCRDRRVQMLGQEGISVGVRGRQLRAGCEGLYSRAGMRAPGYEGLYAAGVRGCQFRGAD